MPVRCRLCDAAFDAHVTVHARASVHWRGKSFDAREAQGSIGLEVMDALGLDASDPRAMDAFLEETHVEAFREDPMGVEPWEGDADRDEGEDWEFHLGFRRALDDDERRRAAEAARRAVEDHENFEEAKVDEDQEAVDHQPRRPEADAGQGGEADGEGAEADDGDGDAEDGDDGDGDVQDGDAGDQDAGDEDPEDGDPGDGDGEAVDTWSHPDLGED